jgi:hypothetical protein
MPGNWSYNHVMPGANPFFHRGPVRNPTYFFGRSDEIRFITELLRAGQSLSLSGPRRIGKSSLLFYLAHPAVSERHGLGPESTRWVYLDGGMLDGLEVEWFYGAVERALGHNADSVSYARFVDTMRNLATNQQRLILVLDEFELIAANLGFGPTLFNHLRGLAGQFPLQFVTISRDPLWQLTFAHHETLSSPFFNIFAPLQLGLFSRAEAIDLLMTLSTQSGRPFPEEAVELILKLVGPHPLFLQVAGYRTFAAVGEEAVLSYEARSTIRAQVLADLEQHFSYYWRNLSPEAQYALAALPFFEAAAHPAILEHLAAAGLITSEGYLGGLLESFVRRQQVEGLLQAGPFLIDTRRAQAAAYGKSIHLTPTEFAALKLFLERSGQLLTGEDIEAVLWPGEIAPDPERARGVVKKLRAALGPAGETIVNRRGQGWLLALEVDD